MRRSWRIVCLVVLGPAYLAIVLPSSGWTGDVSPNLAVQATTDANAAQLVREALEAEAAGQLQQRSDRLRVALEVAPDYAPAHWHSGKLRFNDRWLTPEEAAQANASSGKLDEYRQLRDAAQPTLADHTRLARWCEVAGLFDQQRVHLFYVLELDPKSREAIAKLGLVRFRGELMSTTQIAAIKQSQQRASEALRRWRPRLTALREKFDGGSASAQADVLQQLRAIHEPAAIPALESVFAKSAVELGLAVVAALAEMSGQPSTESLVRHAVFSPHDVVRQSAAEALKMRSLFASVPLLLSGMSSPVEVQFSLLSFNGRVYGQHLKLFQEGPFANVSYVSSSSLTLDAAGILLGDRPLPDNSIASDIGRSQGVAAEVHRANAITQQLNERIATVLQAITATSLAADPQLWWDWWYDYNGYDQLSEKAEYEFYAQSTRRCRCARAIRRGSCFVAGTKVWTATGLMPIEKVEIGESVLTKNPDTGELGYRPVLATTVRGPSPLVEVRLQNETIQSTRGHPLWVSGVGWQMAKELKAGQRLHTPRGSVLIENVTTADDAWCYNLVVADFSTYFIGDSQVLVHDNELRGPTTATVPGLLTP